MWALSFVAGSASLGFLTGRLQDVPPPTSTVTSIKAAEDAATNRWANQVKIEGSQFSDNQPTTGATMRVEQSMRRLHGTKSSRVLYPCPTPNATPDLCPRLAYSGELAAIKYLGRVFGFAEIREALMEFGGQYLCWLHLGAGMVMVGRADADVHQIHIPAVAGLTTVMFNIYVPDIEGHRWHFAERFASTE